MKHQKKYYIIAAGLFLVTGMAQCLRYSYYHGFSMKFFIYLLPATVPVIVMYLRNRYNSKIIRIVSILTSVIIIIFWIVLSIVSEFILISTKENTSIREYHSLLGQYRVSNSRLTDHFPGSVPMEAKDVHFSHLPAFLQGGSHIQLRYSLPQNMIRELYKEYSRVKIKSFSGGNFNDHIHQPGGMPTTFDYSDKKGDRRFSGDFEIMVFDDRSNSKSKTWNHGRSHGVAISLQKNIIIYWAESW